MRKILHVTFILTLLSIASCSNVDLSPSFAISNNSSTSLPSINPSVDSSSIKEEESIEISSSNDYDPYDGLWTYEGDYYDDIDFSLSGE